MRGDVTRMLRLPYEAIWCADSDIIETALDIYNSINSFRVLVLLRSEDVWRIKLNLPEVI